MIPVEKFVKSVWTLPLVAAGVILLITANEISYGRSKTAVGELESAMEVRIELQTLISQVADAETGVRGYLLTRQEDYLKPYTMATAEINGSLDKIRTNVAQSQELLAQFAVLSRAISRKLAELEVSVALKKTNQEIGWRAVIESDQGRHYMEAIRNASAGLGSSLDAAIEHAKIEIRNTLFISRFTIFAAVLLSSIGFTLYFLQAKRLAKAEFNAKQRLLQERDLLDRQVRTRTARLAELTNHLESAREDERAYLARELHDELGALLTTAKLDVARLRSRLSPMPSEVADRVEHLVQTLNAGIALKRRIIEGLRPSSLANLGLVPTLEILARETAERSGINIEVNLEPVSLPAATELTVFRLVQEGFTNICKYASARNVTVTLHTFKNHVELAIRDDGVGFDPEQVRATAHGLTGMQQRVAAAGGKMSVESAPGQGTVISASLPILDSAGSVVGQ
jgi:signal transduction histidine kinase